MLTIQFKSRGVFCLHFVLSFSYSLPSFYSSFIPPFLLPFLPPSLPSFLSTFLPSFLLVQLCVCVYVLAWLHSFITTILCVRFISKKITVCVGIPEDECPLRDNYTRYRRKCFPYPGDVRALCCNFIDSPDDGCLGKLFSFRFLYIHCHPPFIPYQPIIWC